MESTLATKTTTLPAGQQIRASTMIASRRSPIDGRCDVIIFLIIGVLIYRNVVMQDLTPIFAGICDALICESPIDGRCGAVRLKLTSLFAGADKTTRGDLDE